MAVVDRPRAGRRAIAQPLVFRADHSGGKRREYFGFYNMVGKFAAILGPTLMGVSALYVGSRLAILSLLLLFGGGLWLLAKVSDEAPAARSTS